MLCAGLLAGTADGYVPTQAPENLLRNPGFEGEYFAWNGIPEVQVAHEWTPWWIEDVARDPRWHRPEWKRAQGAFYPRRVRSGDSAQQWFTFYASHYAGMYQQVFNVRPGQRYRFSVWVQVWSSLEDNADKSVSPANPRLQIGIEPSGAARPGFASAPGSIRWSFEAPMDQVIDGWALMSIEAEAQNEVITVYLRTNPDFANKHNDIYIDDASLVAVSPPPPTPTATAPPPTASPIPSATLPPTATVPPPTATQPPPTETLPPSATPVPPTATDTKTPSPTATERPSPTTTHTPPAAASSTTAPAEVVAAVSTPASPAAGATGSNSVSGGMVWIWLLAAFAAGAAAAWWAVRRGRRA